jgi:hypothetical protein
LRSFSLLVELSKGNRQGESIMQEVIIAMIVLGTFPEIVFKK